MYHISKDRRAVRSAERIGQGVLQCLESRRFEEITVSDVQRASGVGRATFYRLFDNTADVLSYLCDSVFEQAARQYQALSALTPEETTLRFIQVWMNHKTLLRAIVDCNRMDFLYQAHKKYLSPNENFFPETALMDPVQEEYLMAMLTSCIAAFLTAWMKNGAKESAEQLQQRIKACFGLLGTVFQSPDGEKGGQRGKPNP